MHTEKKILTSTTIIPLSKVNNKRKRRINQNTIKIFILNYKNLYKLLNENILCFYIKSKKV